MSHVQAANPQKEAALWIIQKAGKEGITCAEFLKLEGYIKSLEDHKLDPRVQIEIILQKARKGKNLGRGPTSFGHRCTRGP
jgi:hypothetical protein